MLTPMQKIVPKHLLSRLIGSLAKSENIIIKTLFINLFCLFYPVDMKEAKRTRKSDYLNFNDFFTRSLKDGARPITGRISSPADGTVAALGRIKDNTLIQSKKQSYSVHKLLAERTDKFDKGSFITIYLAPHNYHRVHVPLSAQLNQASYLPGELFSVDSTTAEQLPNLYARNERLICWFNTGDGSMIQILVGAMLVAGIKPVWLTGAYEPRMEVVKNMQREFRQGDELGQFQMGSTVILLFSDPLDFIVEEGTKIQVGQPITK